MVNHESAVTTGAHPRILNVEIFDQGGDGMYTWLAYQAMVASEEQEYAEEYPFDWSRMKRGFEDVIRLNPQWLPSYHRNALTANRFEDRKAVRALFQRPELDWYDGAELMWRERKVYDRARMGIARFAIHGSE